MGREPAYKIMCLICFASGEKICAGMFKTKEQAIEFSVKLAEAIGVPDAPSEVSISTLEKGVLQY